MPLQGKTLTRADLAEAVFEQANLPRNEAAEIVELVLKQIVYALERGESIKLSSFGSFSLRQKNERVGRNPKTGEVVPITPRQVIVFKASNIMKDQINAALIKKPVAKAKTSAAAATKPVAATKSATTTKPATTTKAASLTKSAAITKPTATKKNPVASS